jgi:hypothetical protein
MSLKSIIRGAGRAVAAYYTGGASEAMLAARKKASAVSPVMGMQPMIYDQPQVMPAMGSIPGVGARALPQIGRAIGFGAGVAVAKAGAIARGAAALCSKHPQWCSTIGGVAAVAALMESGQLPVPKRRRGRGLTPRDLRSFRRVARLIRVFAPTVRRIPSRALHVRGTGITHA